MKQKNRLRVEKQEQRSNPMDLELYFKPIVLPNYGVEGQMQERRMGDQINSYSSENNFPEVENIDIAIIGVEESRHSINNHAAEDAPDAIRKYLYGLYSENNKVRIADLGNIKAGEDVNDTYFAVRNALSELLDLGVVVIILGGSQDITYANYLAYQNRGQIINITSIDSQFDLGNAEESFNSKSYLSKIILHQPNFLFNYTNIGYQSYFVDTESTKLMSKMFFDVYRLGHVRNNLKETEPLVRNADMITFDVGAIRQSDAPGNANASPNGLYGEEACQITRYAGMSDKLTTIGFYEYNPEFDQNGQTAHLIAQMVWYFVEGFGQRKNDVPHEDKEDYITYRATIDNLKSEILFFKSKKSGRWWMEVPIDHSEAEKYKRHFMVPCSIEDYNTAKKDEIPDRWWQVAQKLM